MKRIGKLTVLILIAVSMIVPMAFAPRPSEVGPAEKATGTVVTSSRGWSTSFNAHEEKDGRLAKGEMYFWSDEVDRELYLDVKYVKVEGDAWFAALCTYDSRNLNEGKWFFIQVHDGGTPGTAGDEIFWDWDTIDAADAEDRVSETETPSYEHEIIDGNLVVHAYD